MIKRILIILFVFILIALLGLWLVTGGVGRISRAAGAIPNPLNIFGSGGIGGGMHLPWQITLTQGPDISHYVGQDQQDAAQQISDAKTFGDPSPYRGEVAIADRTSDANTSASNEYVELRASTENTAPVQITGWSLQSITTGARVPLPPASSLFILGVVNPVRAVLLNPGASAIVNTGVSPVGVSFRENVCSGYLAQYQSFAPDLDSACPEPKGALPEIPENLRRYGASCFEFVQSLSSCRFPGNGLPSTLSPMCQSFVMSTYSYNGCVNTYQFKTDFNKDSWRLFLYLARPLWSNPHDIIRLLDAQGRTVDVLTY